MGKYFNTTYQRGKNKYKYVKYSRNKNGFSVDIDWDSIDFDKIIEQADIIYNGDSTTSGLNDLYEAYSNAYLALFSLLQHSHEIRQNDDPLKLLLQEQFENNSILDQLDAVLNNEFNQQSTMNLANLLFTQNNDYANQLGNLINNYLIAYNNFYEQFVETIHFTEELNSYIRNETALHQFGILTDKNTMIYSLIDEKNMNQLRRDQSIFKLQVSLAKDEAGKLLQQNGQYQIANIDLQTKFGLTQQNIIDSFINIQKNNKGFLYYKEFKLSDTQGYGNWAAQFINSSYNGQNKPITNGKDYILGWGRLNEAAMWSGLQSPTEAQGQLLMAQLVGVPLDNLPWYYGGDQNFTLNGKRYSISQKSFDFRYNKNASYGVGISSLYSLKYLESLYKDPSSLAAKYSQNYQNVLEESANDSSFLEDLGLFSYENYASQNSEDMHYDANSGTYSFWEDINIEWNA